MYSSDNSSAFFNSLVEVITDPIYIGLTEDDLDQELKTNTWLISCSQEETIHLTSEDFKQFFDAVIENRKQQIQTSGLDHSMLFYLWYDAQAVQLRFSIISDFHAKLPFRATLNIVPSMDLIIEKLLLSHHHDGILWQELKIIDFDAKSLQDKEVDDEKIVLDVYCLTL
jgi:hypothetical protein